MDTKTVILLFYYHDPRVVKDIDRGVKITFIAATFISISIMSMFYI